MNLPKPPGLAHSVTPPMLACPKCGTDYAFREPRYDVPTWTDKDGDPFDGPERLLWDCRTCGYEVEGPVWKA